MIYIKSSFLLSSNQLSLGRAEPHWMPMTQLCDPCQFNPTHVVRMENFSRDAADILEHMGVKGVMEQLDKTSQVRISEFGCCACIC